MKKREVDILEGTHAICCRCGTLVEHVALTPRGACTECPTPA